MRVKIRPVATIATMSHRRTSSVLAVVLALVSLVLAGCGDDKAADTTSGDTGSSGATATTFAFPKDELVDETGKSVVEIKAIDNSLEPRYVMVSPGTRIVWRNEGRNPHDILPDVDGAFPAAKASEMPPGATHTVTLTEPGDYPYYCSTHGTMKSGMNGAIRVAES